MKSYPPALNAPSLNGIFSALPQPFCFWRYVNPPVKPGGYKLGSQFLMYQPGSNIMATKPGESKYTGGVTISQDIMNPGSLHILV